jgi:hypothetical protein
MFSPEAKSALKDKANKFRFGKFIEAQRRSLTALRRSGYDRRFERDKETNE